MGLSAAEILVNLWRSPLVSKSLGRSKTLRNFLDRFFSSYEVRYRVLGRSGGLLTPSMTGAEPRLHIQHECTESELERIFRHVETSWNELGKTEPYWSVLTSEEFRAAAIRNHAGFYRSGENDVGRLIATLNRNAIDLGSIGSCLEYGCGVGRVTVWLAKRFEHVFAYDVSEYHLQIANQYFRTHGLQNISTHLIKSRHDLESLPSVDLIYSVIVLQHNPPPVIAILLERFLKTLHKGGICVLQVPTYCRGYSFNVEDYLSTSRPPYIEMHVLTQKTIFDIVARNGGRVIEVFQDNAVGSMQYVSNHFVLTKV